MSKASLKAVSLVFREAIVFGRFEYSRGGFRIFVKGKVKSEEGRVKNPCVKGKVRFWRLWRPRHSISCTSMLALEAMCLAIA